ncbi:MAG: CoA-binding protein [Nitrospinota bacterium]
MNPSERRLAEILANAHTIAVVGLSDDPSRTSHRIASYLQAAGYRIIPVNPEVAEVLGEKALRSLEEIGEPVDIVDVFRRPALIPPVAEDFLRMRRRPGVFWMQKGIAHPGSARRLEEAGAEVVQDLCIKTVHRLLLAGQALG